MRRWKNKSAKNLLKDIEEGIKVLEKHDNTVYSCEKCFYPMKQTKLSKAIKTLIEHLGKDNDYYYGWQANIAMPFYDTYNSRKKDKKYLNRDDIHNIANEAAKSFLCTLMNSSYKK